jgi:hypothetical protein
MVMQKTTVYLPEELKAELERMAAETGTSEAKLIRDGIRLALARRYPQPTIPIMISDDPHFAERVDADLAGFGER